MDQDNKRISIDDLVRQRLGGHEEPERSGAWANMRALLDEQEQKAPRGAYFWNRRNLSALLLLLVGGATMGSLLLQSPNAGTAGDASTTGVAAATNPVADLHPTTTTTGPVTIADRSLATAPAGTLAPGVAAGNGRTTRAGSESRPATQPAQPSGAGSNHPGAIASTGTNLSGDPATGNNTPVRQPKPGLRNRHQSANNNVADATSTSSSITGRSAKTGRSPFSRTSSNSNRTPAGSGTAVVSAGVKPAPASSVAAENPANAGEVRTADNRARSPKGSKVRGRGKVRTTGGQQPATIPDAGSLALNTAAGNILPNAGAGAPRKQKVTVPSHTVVRRPVRDPRTRRIVGVADDTVGQGTAVILRDLPSLPEPDAATAMADAAASILAPAAPAGNTAVKPALTVAKRVVLPEPWEPVLTPAAVNLAARTKAAGTTNLRLHGSSGTGNHAKSSYDRKLELGNFFRTLNFQLSQIKVHPGMTAGLNSAPFGDITLNGFHLGATVTFVVNEAWSVMTELRYNRKMAGNQVLNDDYVQCSPYSSNNGPNGTTYAWTEDSVSRFFNIAGLHYVDLPAQVRYHYRKFFFEGGLNFMYAFGMNVEEREFQVAQGVQRSYTVSSQYAAGFVPGYDVMKPTMQTTDFGSRFGMGLNLGLGYQISPAVQADLRVSRQFWDNAKTRGAMKVSDLLYNQPVLQLSIGYRFGERE